MRHKIRNSDGEYTLGIACEQYINPIKWRKYVPPFDILGDDFEKSLKDLKLVMHFHKKYLFHKQMTLKSIDIEDYWLKESNGAPDQ
jgi:hypothetical protein